MGEARGGSWADLVRQSFDAELHMLPYRRYPVVELQRGLGGGVLYEAVFNFVHFHAYQGLAQFDEIRSLGDDYFEETSFTFLASRCPSTCCSSGRSSLMRRASHSYPTSTTSFSVSPSMRWKTSGAPASASR